MTPRPRCTLRPCSTWPAREKDKSRVSELLQGLAFSDDSEAEEDSDPEVQPERKLKASNMPEKS